MRKIINCEQGDETWHAHRNTPGIFNGSEIAAIMGLSSYVTRAELLRQKATGIEPEFDAATLRRFADGHKSEALARPLAEEIIGDDLSPLVMMDEFDGILLSVSLDGVTFGNSITFEHKSLNQRLAASLDAGVLPDEYHPQCESGLMVSGATKCLFMASKDGDASTERHIWYEPNPQFRKCIIAECKQFAIDLENYVPPAVTVEPIAATIEALPALMIQVEGRVLATNLDQFKAAAQTFIANINTDLQTDQHFADADKTVKFLKEGEERLAREKERALAQTASIDELFRTIDAISGQMKDKRLMLDKLVAAEKTNRKQEILLKAQTDLHAHITATEKRIGVTGVIKVDAGFGTAIKGMSKLDNIREAVNTAARNAWFDVNAMAETIEENRKAMSGAEDLFQDFAQVCAKPFEDFVALLAMRVANDNKRLEAERVAAAAQTAAAVAKAIEGERAAKARTDQQWDMDKTTLGSAQGVVASTAATNCGEPVATLQAGAAVAFDVIKPTVDEQRITAFLACVDMSITEKKALRANLLKWEKFRMAAEMKAAA